MYIYIEDVLQVIYSLPFAYPGSSYGGTVMAKI